MIAILHNIRSLQNVGSMFRTADAVGIEKIFLTGYSPSPQDRMGSPRPKMTKTSLGAERTVAWEKQSDPKSVIQKLKQQGYTIIAVEQSPKSVPLQKFRPAKQNVALLVGNEVRGLSKPLLRQCDKIIEIPMYGQKESLNVAVAFGIVSYFIKLRT